MSVIIPMCLFSLAMSISPGPVNMITLSTGVNHGFKKAMPFVSGATIGFTLLLLMIGLGMGSLFSQSSVFLKILAYGGTGFIIYLGYKIAISETKIETGSKGLPNFSQGFFLQWLNPKAWTACLAGVSAFNLTDSIAMLMVFVGLYFVICYLSIASWALLGEKIESNLGTQQNLRIFNGLMGSGLIIVAFYLLYVQVSPL